MEETENVGASEREDQETRNWSFENEVGRFVSEARKRQDEKDKTNAERRRQEEEKLIKEKPKK